MFLTKVLHILYCIIIFQYDICVKDKSHNNLNLVVSLVQQIYLTCFVEDGLNFAH